MCEIYLQVAFRLLTVVANLYQRRYNRLHRSIYGLSYDLFVLESIGNCILLYCALNYRYSYTLRTQLQNRFPLFYNKDDISTLPLSQGLLLVDLIVLVSCVAILKQLILYRSSKHIYQGVSVLCTSILFVVAVFAVFTYTCACYNLPLRNSGRFGVFYLEHINYLWIMGNMLLMFKFLPQCTLNWMGRSTTGLSSRYTIINMFRLLLEAIAYFSLPKVTDFYNRPINYTPIVTTWVHFLCISLILSQAQKLYVNCKPYLPKGKLLSTTR